MSARLSVIVPVFNAQSQVVLCVSSLLHQNFDGLEMIFVDDCSKDDSISVIKERLEDCAYDRGEVKFLKTESNSGPGAARNLGLKAASGEYVAFLDSDDWYDPDFCSKMYSAANGADLVCCDISLDRGFSHDIRKNPVFEGPGFSGKAKKKYLKTVVSYFTTYIYKRSLLLEKGIEFPATHSAEDSCFLLSCLLCASSLVRVQEPLYHYVLRNSSVSLKKDKARPGQRMASFRELRAFAKRAGVYPEYKSVIEYLIFKKGTLMALKDKLWK